MPGIDSHYADWKGITQEISLLKGCNRCQAEYKQWAFCLIVANPCTEIYMRRIITSGEKLWSSLCIDEVTQNSFYAPSLAGCGEGAVEGHKQSGSSSVFFAHLNLFVLAFFKFGSIVIQGASFPFLVINSLHLVHFLVSQCQSFH